jgi:hypothetical protein
MFLPLIFEHESINKGGDNMNRYIRYIVLSDGTVVVFDTIKDASEIHQDDVQKGK